MVAHYSLTSMFWLWDLFSLPKGFVRWMLTEERGQAHPLSFCDNVLWFDLLFSFCHTMVIYVSCHLL
jgi:hypothetical protein